MPKAKVYIIVILLLVVAASAAYFWYSADGSETDKWLGYVEGETVYIAAPVGGTLAVLEKNRGAWVEVGELLFRLDSSTHDAEVARLRAEVDAARSRLADLRKDKQRKAEIAVTRASGDAARAVFIKAQADYRRISLLAAGDFVSRAQLDAAKAALASAEANVRRVRAQQLSGEISLGRSDQISAARARIESAKASLRVQQRRGIEIAPLSPDSGIIEQTYFNRGEWVPANRPVVALLPRGKRKIRFFVPQDRIASLRLGQSISFTCDGCGAQRSATLSYIAPRSEFTPPVIYSEQARSKLVFMVEAALPEIRAESQAGSQAFLPIGLPITVIAPQPQQLPQPQQPQ